MQHETFEQWPTFCAFERLPGATSERSRHTAVEEIELGVLRLANACAWTPCREPRSNECDPNHQDDDAHTLEPATANEPPHANLVVQPASVNLNQSSSASFSVGVTRINFSGAVTFSIEGAPAGRSFSVSINPASVSIASGARLNVPVTVTRSNGITESILVSVENVPVYMSANAGFVAAGTSGGTMALSTTTRLLSGTYPLFLRGSVTGETDIVFPFSVTVTK